MPELILGSHGTKLHHRDQGSLPPISSTLLMAFITESNESVTKYQGWLLIGYGQRSTNLGNTGMPSFSPEKRDFSVGNYMVEVFARF